MKLTRSRTTLILGAVIILSLAIRLYRLNLNIPPLYADEAGQVYLLQWLNSHPLSVGNLLTSVYNRIFTFTWFLGKTTLAVRLPAAIYGSLLPLGVFFLANGMKGDKQSRWRISLIAAGLTAVLPWSFMISRIGHTHIPILLMLVCLYAGLYLRGKLWWSFLPLMAAAYVYSSIIVMLPFILGLVFYQQAKVRNQVQRWKLIAGGGAVALIGLMILMTRYKGLSPQARGLDLAIWRDVNVTAETDLYRGIARDSSPTIFSLNRDPELINRLFYNFPVAVVAQFTENYLSFFTPEWLFLKGDPILRHSTNMVGEFYPFLLPFMVYGAYVFMKQRNNDQTKQLFGVWILASPIPAALTNDGAGYLLRAITMMPFLTILTAIGIVELSNRITGLRQGSGQVIRNQYFKFGYWLFVLGVGAYSFYYFLFGYFHVFPTLAARSFESGFKELAEFQQDKINQSMLVIWSGYYPRSYFRFWQSKITDSEDLSEPMEIKTGNSTFYQTDERLFFGWPKSVDDLTAFLNKQPIDWLVFPTSYLEQNPEYKIWTINHEETIKIPDGQPAFEIYNLD